MDGYGLVDPDGLLEAWSVLSSREYVYVDLLLYQREDLEVIARVFVGENCLELVEVSVRSCGNSASMLLALSEEPEVDSVVLEKKRGVSCTILRSRPEPPLKPLRLLDKLGITKPLAVLAYKPVDVGEV